MINASFNFPMLRDPRLWAIAIRGWTTPISVPAYLVRIGSQFDKDKKDSSLLYQRRCKWSQTTCTDGDRSVDRDPS